MPLIVLLTICFASHANAAIVTATMAADVQADFRNQSQSDHSSVLSDTIGATASQGNSTTSTSLAYAFDFGAGQLTANSLIIAEKTQNRGRGGDHSGSISMVFDFQVDSQMSYSLDGTWGFLDNSTSGTADSLTYLLTGPSGTIVAGATTVSTGIGADSFSETGILNAGTYQLSFQADLNERFNNRSLAQAGWTVDRFKLTEVSAIPEPSSMVFFGLLSAVLATRRRRSKTAPVA